MRSTMERKPFERCGVRCSRKPEPLEQRDRIGVDDFRRGLARIEREQNGDQPAHDVSVAVSDE